MDDEVIQARQGGFSLSAGLLFSAGWWVFIDGYNMGNIVLKDGQSTASAGYAWLPLFAATLFFLMINGMKWSELSDENVSDPRTAAKARIFVIFALFIAFAGIGGSAFIMADKFLAVSGSYQWAGISCLVGTMLIVASAFLMRFGTLPPRPGSW